MMIKKTTLYLIVTVLIAVPGIAQDTDYSFKKGDVIWVGNSNINSVKQYFYNSTNDEYHSVRSTRFSLNFKRISLLSESSGIGLLGQTQVLVSDRYNFSLSYLGAGALYRHYVLNRSKINMYVEGNSMLGYNIALADATGSTKSDGFRIRPALKYGVNINLNKTAGLFFEIGPEWESSMKDLVFDSKALRATIGIQFLKNK
ncbi:MAG: hypothetical protein JJ895_04670 [Balneolaceae bacterium]|nr:hypothetical protein [Balneolaceae bacterium]